jgi:hypothetical protein
MEETFILIIFIVIIILVVIINNIKNSYIEELEKLISHLIDDNVNLYVYYLEHSKKEIEPFEEFNKE